MSTLLDICGKIDHNAIAIYETIDQAATALNMPYMVIGAAARDLLLHYGYGARLQRATEDIDFGIQVGSWQEFSALHEMLLQTGFSQTRMTHRLRSANGSPVDIVPFGRITTAAGEIAWPPTGEIKMKVTGFADVLASTIYIRLRASPKLEIPVVTPPGLVLLKLIAWLDRDRRGQRKDAADLRYLLETYEEIPEISKSLHDHQAMLELYDWDLRLGGAHLLGQHARQIAAFDTLNLLVENYHAGGLAERLAMAMCHDIDEDFTGHRALLAAFLDGLMQA